MANMNNISWWQWVPVPGRLWRIVQVVEAADELPKRLPRNAAVLVGSYDKPKWLAFDCPCRSGHRVMLNLDSGRRPHWRIADKKKLTVSPSVDWNTSGRVCHYFIRSGRVIWV